MRAPITLILLASFAAGCDGVAQGTPGNARPAALDGVVAGDSVTAETRRLLGPRGPADPTSDRVSPDGRWAAGTNWVTGDVAIQDLASGEVRHVTAIEDFSAFTMSAVIAPDGDRVAFTWYEFESDRADLRVATLDGEDVRIDRLYARPGSWSTPLDWSPDGEFVLTATGARDGTTELALVRVAGGDARLLKSLGWSTPQGGGFSPDGNHVAFDFAPDPDAPVRHIHVVSTIDARGGAVAAGPWHDYFLGWAPDGHILFLSDRGGTRGVWRIAMQDGRPAGAAELVKPDVWRAAGAGFDDRGRFYYNVVTGARDVHVATLDLAAGRVLTPPAPAASREIAGTRGPAWSPDGQRLAYLAERSPWGGGVLSDRIAMVKTLETGEVRSVPLPAHTRGVELQRWSSDGRHLLLRARFYRPGQAFIRLDTQTGEAAIVPLEPIAEDLFWFAALPDGHRVVAWRDVAGADTGGPAWEILVIDTRTGEKRAVARIAGRIQVVPSPDGREVAVAVRQEDSEATTIRVYPLEGGEGRIVLGEAAGIATLDNLAWAADGSALLFTSGPVWRGEEEVPLRIVPLTGESSGQPREVAHLPRGTSQLATHPDGRRIAFRAGTPMRELWVMDRIGPVVARTAPGRQ